MWSRRTISRSANRHEHGCPTSPGIGEVVSSALHCSGRVTGYSATRKLFNNLELAPPSGKISAEKVGFCLRMRLDPLGRKTGWDKCLESRVLSKLVRDRVPMAAKLPRFAFCEKYGRETGPPIDSSASTIGFSNSERIDRESKKAIMQIRVAQPTDKLAEVVAFYRDGMGLPVIAHFENHDGYSGVILRTPIDQIHLEFTHAEAGSPCPAPTKDNLLVFYIPKIRCLQKQ